MAIKDNNGNVTYAGCVFNIWERNGYNDSDFYADCFNPETGKIDTIEYDTTRCGGCGSAEVDITEENYRSYLRNGYNRMLQEFIGTVRRNEKTVGKGKKVVVVKGRKVPKGTTGECFWIGNANFDRYKRWWNEVTRIGFKDENGNVHWTNASNVEVIINEHRSVSSIVREFKKNRSAEFVRMKECFEW
jgi:hypothetical protein